ncbi:MULTISPECIES: alpha/beta fold hydrolase [unclassified Mycobacterium]|uniref:alpha/beta fold hydrolase n=1 Tax=unclassified Mycobacterium TaxID=2642494 RepID=UPI000FC229C9|nr:MULTISPECIES: alpha/beta hydrolase [unclassified Mycobacterium]MDP7701752.1 alpha/beta hydrolase [Mycobacterium sp. TY815]MDP7724586.1 alpha/beta hydrolase [Mycobacterium sp. TY814]RUP01291.1 MAG: alpha/beta hydrolase [Mycobacterium sp.]
MTTEHVRWTASGVRMRLYRRRSGDANWLFLPGGPGIGSESLQELVDAVAVSGCSWLVDLPGDGSNVDAPGAPADPYSLWPEVLAEASRAVERPIYVGHSTGGEYLLSTPALAEVLHGLVLISTAPDASWMPLYDRMTADNPLPGVEAATARYAKDPTRENLREVAVQSAPWNFLAATVAAGAELLGRMPYNIPAVQWSAEHFDRDYQFAWWPSTLPTLIISGSEDRIVTQSLWRTASFQTENVLWSVIPEAGHFPWMEQPEAVRGSFAELEQRIGVSP